MSLFRRRRADRADDESFAEEPEDSSSDADDAGPTTADDGPDDHAPIEGGTRDDEADRADVGPYDVDEAPDDDLDRLDLGSLRIPALPGVEMQIQANEQGEIAAVALVSGNSAMEIGAFAAPRTEGIWDEVRAELRQGIAAEGGKVTEADGEYGVELHGRIKTPDGPQNVRFVGVDGPRWFVRAVFHGAVAVDPTVAPDLVECLRRTIVDRGKEAMPVREPLPLRLPAEALEQQARAQQESAAESTGDPRTPDGRVDSRHGPDGR